MSGDRVAAGRHAVGIDLRGCIFPGDLAAIASPSIRHSMLGIEISNGDSRGNRLTRHHFCGLHCASGGRRQRHRTTPAEHKAGAQTNAFE